MSNVRLLAVILMLCAGCQSQPMQRTAARPSGYEAMNLSSVGAPGEGPAGVMSSDTGFVWILPRTNRYFWVETKDVLHNTVVRYLHDREVYGPSLTYWPGEIDSVNHPELPETLNPAAFFRTRYTTNTP